jgi:hypothetical protein
MSNVRGVWGLEFVQAAGPRQSVVIVNTPFRIKRLRTPQWAIAIAFLAIVGILASSDNAAAQAIWGAPGVVTDDGARGTGDDKFPKIKPDGTGKLMSVWQTNKAIGGAAGTDIDVVFSLSADNGTTWSDVSFLNSNAFDDSGDDTNPELATDGAGNWVVVWRTTDDLGSSIGTDGDILVSRSSNNGLNWTAPAVVNSNATSDTADDADPRVVTDSAGNWVVIWESDEDLGGSFDADYEIYFSRSTDNGANWSAMAPLNTNATTDAGNDFDPHCTYDGTSVWATVWTSDEELGGSLGPDFEILISRSTDSGATWSAPAALNTNAASDSGNDMFPFITSDNAGNWVAAWQTTDTLGGTIGSDNDILVSRSTDGAVTWSTVAILNTNAATDSGEDVFPVVTTDTAGNWVAVWLSTDSLGNTIGTDEDILVSRSSDNGATWTTPAALNDNAGTDTTEIDANAQVVYGGNSKWTTVWHSNTTLSGSIGEDFDILISRSADNGATWIPEVALNSDAAASPTDHSPRIATDGAGNWVAVWYSDDLGDTSGTDLDILVSFSTDDAATWSFPETLSSLTDFGNDFSPQITTDGAGNWVAAWNSDDTLGGTIGSDMDILVSRSTDNGASWTPAAALNTNAASDSGTDQMVQVATDGVGKWVAVWTSTDTLGGTLGGEGDILVARSTDNGANWTAPAALNNTAISDTGADTEPQVLTDGAGNWLAIWTSTETPGDPSGTDFDILASLSTDNGATWTTPIIVNTNAIGDVGADLKPQLTTNGAGKWIVVWNSDDDLGGTIGTDLDILVSGSADNGATWSTVAVLNTNATSDVGDDIAPQISYGMGYWTVAWYSNDTLGNTIGADQDILVSRSSDDGATWTAPAALNSNAASDTGDDLFPNLVSNKVGTWVTVWQSTDPFTMSYGTDEDILFAKSLTPLVLSINGVNAGGGFTGSVDFDVLFNTSVTGVDVTDFGLGSTGPIASIANVSGSGDAYTVNVSVTGGSDGNLFVDLFDDDSILDAASEPLGGPGTGNGDFTDGTNLFVDMTPPGLTLSSTASDPVTSAITVDVAIDETSDFDPGDISPTNAVVSNFSGAGLSYSFTLTPSAQGLFSAVVDAGTFNDVAGNANTASNTLSRTLDSVGPTVSLSSAAPDPVTAAISVDVSLSEVSTDFDASDVTPTNATVNGFTGSGDTYSFTLTPTGQGLFSAVVNATTCTDALGNANSASNTLSRTYDTVGPGVALSSTAPDPTNGAITVNVVLTEPSINFDAGDVSPTNAAVSGFAGSVDTYSFTLTPSAQGSFSAAVNGGAFTDATGNGNTPSNTLTRTLDSVGPTVTLSSTAPDPVAGAITVNVSLNEASTDFGVLDITPANATVSNFTGSAGTYSFTLTPTAAGLFSAQVTAAQLGDALGNPNSASNTLSRTFDNTLLGVTLSSVDPNPANGPIDVTATLTKPSADFDATDITTTNGTVGNFATVSGAEYTFTLTPSAQGAFSASVNAGVCTDTLGNANLASNTLNYTFDSLAPSVTLLSSAPEFTTVSPVPITVSFSEAVTSFIASDVTVGNGSVSNFTGSSSAYHFDVTPAGNGAVTVSIAAGVCVDAAGNGNTASTTLTRTFDNSAVPGSLRGALAGAVKIGPGQVELEVLGNALVRIESLERSFERLTPSDLNGNYLFRDLPAGQYKVEVFAPSFESGEATIVIPGGGAEVVRDLILEESSNVAGVTGVVLDQDTGNPIIGVKVDAFVGGDTEPTKTTYTGGDGSYEITGLAEKAEVPVQLEFTAPAYETEVVEVTVDSTAPPVEENVSAEKTIEAPGALTGFVLRGAKVGEPVADARVVVAGLIITSATTDGTGFYHFDALLEDTYSISISKEGYETIEGSVSVTSLSISEFSVDAIPTPAPSAARLEDVNGSASVDAVDVQLVINAALGLITGVPYDVNRAAGTDAVDVQLVINGALE